MTSMDLDITQWISDDRIDWKVTKQGVLVLSGYGPMRNWRMQDVPWRAYRERITEVEIQEGITSIGENAFGFCVNLTSVHLPSGLRTIGWGAFRGCEKLQYIRMPSSVQEIGVSAFSGCVSLTSIVLPEGITCLEWGTFCSCGLLNVIIPASVKWVNGAFIACQRLRSVTILGSAIAIYGGFLGCKSLTKITMPKSMRYIGPYSFYQCEQLQRVVFSGTQTEWDRLLSASQTSGLRKDMAQYLDQLRVPSQTDIPKEKKTVPKASPFTGFRTENEQIKWYENGSFRKDMTGIVEGIIDGKSSWYYIQEGVFASGSGIAQKADGSMDKWFYVQNGEYTKASGIAQKADGSSGKWFYVQKGVYSKVSGIAQKADKSSGKWFYVQNGIFTKKDCIARKADGSSEKLYYVQNGVFAKVTGTYTIDSVSYQVVNGVVQ